MSDEPAVRHVRDVPAEPVPAGTGISRQVLISSDEAPHFAMRCFTIIPGGSMPLHTNTVEHEQYVLRGRARVRIGETVHEVEGGSIVLIPAGVPHDYVTLGDEPFEFLCLVPNEPDRIGTVEEHAHEENLDAGASH